MTDRKQIELANPDSEIFTALNYSPKHKIFALGTQSGKVLLAEEDDLTQQQLVYRGSGKVLSLEFSQDDCYLVIALEEASAVIYSFENKKFVRCRSGYQVALTSYAVMNRLASHLLSIDSEGYLAVYRFSIEEVSLVEKYKVI